MYTGTLGTVYIPKRKNEWEKKMTIPVDHAAYASDILILIV